MLTMTLRPRWVLAFLAGACLLVVFALATDPFTVAGNSMMPGLDHGDTILVNRFTRPGQLKRGDLVVVKHPSHAGMVVVKRVVGLPGDTVSLDQGRLYVNAELIAEPYVVFRDRRSMAELRLGPKMYFVMGDQRQTSVDSRTWGPVRQESIVGQAYARIWPLRRSGPID